ncbi:Collagen Alpha-6(Vi) Chain [Manis pentadactyla]|nr:Collagen Alpha-6(Vi) Chain [Manis pentadactyla]
MLKKAHLRPGPGGGGQKNVRELVVPASLQYGPPLAVPVAAGPGTGCGSEGPGVQAPAAGPGLRANRGATPGRAPAPGVSAGAGSAGDRGSRRGRCRGLRAEAGSPSCHKQTPGPQPRAGLPEKCSPEGGCGKFLLSGFVNPGAVFDLSRLLVFALPRVETLR